MASDEVVPNVGRVVRDYIGSGGINRFSGATDLTSQRNLSIGINASYLLDLWCVRRLPLSRIQLII
jgi:hypothetical protein